MEKGTSRRRLGVTRRSIYTRFLPPTLRPAAEQITVPSAFERERPRLASPGAQRTVTTCSGAALTPQFEVLPLRPKKTRARRGNCAARSPGFIWPWPRRARPGRSRPPSGKERTARASSARAYSAPWVGTKKFYGERQGPTRTYSSRRPPRAPGLVSCTTQLPPVRLAAPN